MPKLPDYTALSGASDVPRPSGITPSYSASGFTPTNFDSGAGQALEKAGAALGDYATKEQNKAGNLQQAQSEADFSISSGNLFKAAGQSRDYENAGGQFRADTTQELDRISQGIADPYQREMFVQKHRATIDAHGRTLDDHLWKQYAQDTIEKNNERFDQLARNGLTNPDPQYRADVVGNIKTIIQGEVQAGYITPAQGVARQRQFVEKYAESWIKTLPAEEARKMLEPFVTGAPKAEAKNPRSAGAVLGDQTGGPQTDQPGGSDQPATPGGTSTGGVIESAAKSAGVDPSLMRRFAKIESGGDPNAVSGSYKGLFQLSKAEFEKYGGGDIFNPADNANAAAKKIAAEGEEFRSVYGRAPTATDLYLIHQQGAAGYRAHVTNPDAPAWQNMLSTGEGKAKGEKWAKAAIWGNVPDQLKDQYGSVENITSAQFISLWDKKVGGSGQIADMVARPRTGTLADFISPDKIPALYEGATRQLLAERTAASTTRFDDVNRLIIDGKAGVSLLPPRDLIEKDPILNPDKKNALLKEYDAASKDVGTLNSVIARFQGAPGTFNPYDKDERQAVDKVYQMLGGKDQDPKKQTLALQAVVDKTATIPDSVALSIRGGLTSTDPVVVQRSLELSSNILTRSPNVFVGAAGKEDFEKAAITYRHYVDDLGMSGTDAAKKFIEQQTPEYQAKLTKIKSEDIAKIVKDKVSINDVRGAFDDSWIPFNDPNIGFSPGQRQSMFDTYVEQFKGHYAENGDVNLSKKLAGDDLKKTWGVTTVNGSKVVVPYPPEKSPRFSGLENAPEVIANQAIAAIKAETGNDVKREQLQFQPIPAVTATAFKSGQPTPYNVLWSDKNGVVHTLNPGRAFAPDAKQAVAEADAKRTAEFEAARTKEIATAQEIDVRAKQARSTVEAMQRPMRRVGEGRDVAIRSGLTLPGGP